MRLFGMSQTRAGIAYRLRAKAGDLKAVLVAME
jgi:hypothetical protein